MKSQQTPNVLNCDMIAGCLNPVTHLGNKGYIYCASCGMIRRASGQERVRKMTPIELRMVQSGNPLERY